MSTKRRLSVLPEVLPAPQRSGESSVRERTLQRMKVLAALGAATIAASCGTQQGGYGVVDPMPSPSCFEKNPKPTVTASYVAADAGADAAIEPQDAGGSARRVEMTIAFDRETDVVFSSASADVPILETSMSSTGGRLLLSIPEGRTTAAVTVPFSCSSNGGTLTIHLTLGSSVTVTVDDT